MLTFQTRAKPMGFALCIVIVLFLLPMLFLSGCDSFKPFDDIPDANIEDEYYANLIERYTRYCYLYSYFVISDLAEANNGKGNGSVYYDLEGPAYKLYEDVYTEWKEEYPDKVQIVESHKDKLLKMVSEFTYSSGERRFESMKTIVDGYIKCVYLEDPEETDNYEIYVSADFLEKQPKERVKDYLTEHNIHVTNIVFKEIFTKFSQFTYPFKLAYPVDVYYYIGDEEIPEEKWKSATLNLDIFIGQDDNGNYVIEYISNADKYKEVIYPTDVMVESLDFDYDDTTEGMEDKSNKEDEDE